jgi:hypothetical protein
MGAARPPEGARTAVHRTKVSIMTTDNLPPLIVTPPGLYRHYKGNLYQVIDTVRHSETLEPLTLYRALYGEHGLWVRPAAMFGETVVVNGVSQPRFARVADGGAPEAA